MTLLDTDERFHTPAAPERRWQENFFFILWDTATRNGFMVHLQRVPALGWQEAQAVASIGGRLGSATLRRPFAADSGVDEVRMTPVDPYRDWHLEAEFAGTEGYGPLGFVFTAPGGATAVAADLRLHSDLAATDFGEGLRQVVLAMHDDPSGPQMTHAEHYEQGGTWEGTLRIGDQQVSGAGLFVRDHSWGPRNEQNAFRAFWTATCLDEGRVFCNAIGIVQPGGVAGIGAMTDASGTRFTTDVDATYEPAPGVHTYERATVRYGGGIDRTLTATTQVHLPMYLPHSGPRRYDNNAISAVAMDGLDGFGVMEWADVLEPEQVAELDQYDFAAEAITPASSRT